MKTKEELIQIGLDSFKRSPESTRKWVPVRIRINGQFIKTDSNKSVWKCIGHAKNALRNHLDLLYSRLVYASRYSNFSNESIKLEHNIEEAVEAIMKIAEYVPVSNDVYTAQTNRR